MRQKRPNTKPEAIKTNETWINSVKVQKSGTAHTKGTGRQARCRQIPAIPTRILKQKKGGEFPAFFRSATQCGDAPACDPD
jgi:hypothetical protein